MSVVMNPPEPVVVPEPPVVVASRRELPLFTRWLLIGGPVLLALVFWGLAVAAWPLLSHDPAAPYGRYVEPVVVDPPTSADGAAVFAANCAYCHGPNGHGDGVARVDPPARYFGRDKFKFGGTENGVPTDDDLDRIIRRGIPGSAMPAFPQLLDVQRAAVAAHVRQLAWAGAYERALDEAVLLGSSNNAARAKNSLKVRQLTAGTTHEAVKGELAKLAGEEFDPKSDWKPEKMAAQADKLTALGPAVSVPRQFYLPSGASVGKGRAVFGKSCSSCHGPEGKGDGKQVSEPTFVNDNGTKAYPRDLTSGVYKGGGDPGHLYLRIFLGIPGTPMSAAGKTVSEDDILNLINYVRSLPPPYLRAPEVDPADVAP